jgi:hypothetical protein
MSVKPIETQYNGYRYRSRLEARWAVFFDTLNVQYVYEPEGFRLPYGGDYLPDFYLPRQKCWIEIKSERPSSQEQIKAADLSFHKRVWVDIISGQIGNHGITSYKLPQHTNVHGIQLLICPNCRSLMFGKLERGCGECGAGNIGLVGHCYACDHGCEFQELNDTKLKNAYTKARSARFEFGESG